MSKQTKPTSESSATNTTSTSTSSEMQVPMLLELYAKSLEAAAAAPGLLEQAGDLFGL